MAVGAVMHQTDRDPRRPHPPPGRGWVSNAAGASVEGCLVPHMGLWLLFQGKNLEQTHQISGGTCGVIGTSKTVGTSVVHAFVAASLIASRSSTRTASQP